MDLSVYLLSQLCIHLTAEGWAGMGVGINGINFIGTQHEMAALIGQLAHSSREEREISAVHLFAKGEQGELKAAMDTREDRLSILKVMKTH